MVNRIHSIEPSRMSKILEIFDQFYSHLYPISVFDVFRHSTWLMSSISLERHSIFRSRMVLSTNFQSPTTEKQALSRFHFILFSLSAKFLFPVRFPFHYVFYYISVLVIRSEKKLRELGGSNLEAFKETTSHEVFDFFSFGTTAFDTFKSYFLVCFFWITLAVLFLAGTTRINLFGLGYVLGSFIFLWNGNEFFLKPVRSIFKSWTLIILYTCIVMFLKSLIQVFVVTLLRNHLCWLVQLLGITYHQNESIDSRTKELLDVCPTTEAGLLWDGICLTFLLIQKRIFCSHYFKYLIREIKAQQFLASRGAELIHEIQAQEVSEQEIAEREVMEKIKQKMDRIKEAQQKMFANQARSIKYHKQGECIESFQGKKCLKLQ